MNKKEILKLFGSFVIVGIAGFIVGYNLIKKYKEASDVVDNTLEKINMGVDEMTEFLRNKNQEFEEKIKEKKENKRF